MPHGEIIGDTSGSSQANGVLDDVQIFNYELSAGTVAGQAAPANTKPVYDTNGNLTNDGNGTSYAWDAENRLIRITYSGGATSNFSYDPLGRRVSIVEKNSGGTLTSTRNLLWAGQQIIQERDASNTVTKKYYAQGVKIGSSSYYYSKDHLGSIRELTDSSGVVQARYDYDTYGNATKLSGSIDSDFQYAGYYYHSPSKLNLTLFRAYDSNTARWLSRDTIEEKGGLNLYGYVAENPISGVDPFGLCDQDSVLNYKIGVAAVGGAKIDISFDWSTGQVSLKIAAIFGIGLEESVSVSKANFDPIGVTTIPFQAFENYEEGPIQLELLGVAAIDSNGQATGKYTFSAGDQIPIGGGNSLGSGVEFNYNIGSKSGLDISRAPIQLGIGGMAGGGPAVVITGPKLWGK